MKYLVIGAGGTGGCIGGYLADAGRAASTWRRSEGTGWSCMAPGAGSCGCGSPPAPPGNLPDART